MTEKPKKPRTPKQIESDSLLAENNKETRIRSGVEAVTKGRKGGIKSGEVRRQNRLYNEYLRKALEKTSDSTRPMTDIDDLPSLSKDDLEQSNLPAEQKWAIAMVRNLIKGDVRSSELALKILGQMPSDKVEVSGEVAIKPRKAKILAMLKAAKENPDVTLKELLDG